MHYSNYSPVDNVQQHPPHPLVLSFSSNCVLEKLEEHIPLLHPTLTHLHPAFLHPLFLFRHICYFKTTLETIYLHQA